MNTVWDWLVTQGLYHDLVSAFILVPIMRIMALKPLKRVENAVKRVENAIDTAIDRELDRMREERSRDNVG